MGKGKKKRNNERAAGEKVAASGPVEQPQPEESDPSSLERPLEDVRLTEPEKKKPVKHRGGNQISKTCFNDYLRCLPF